MNQITLEEEIIMVTTETIHKLFSYENGSDVVALYMFYHKQCKMQGTNQSFSTGDFVKKGMKWGNVRFLSAKSILKELGLIEDIVKRDDKGQVEGWYVKLNFIRSLNKATLSTSAETHPVDESTGGGQETNAGSSITINAGSSENVNATQTRVKKKKVETERLPLPTKEEVLSFIGDTGGTRKIYSILELPNMTQSFSLQDILDLKNWMITFFMEKYPSRIFKNKEGELEGGNIILDELDKFYGYYLQKPEVEIKSVKGRMINWIITSTKPFNPKK